MNNYLDKKVWLLTIFFNSLIILIALHYQYNENSQPCLLCIYIRTAFIGMTIVAIAGYLTRKIYLAKNFFIISNLIIISYGIIKSHRLTLIFSGEIKLHSCSFMPNFWIPIHKWMPSIFLPKGLCENPGKSILGLNMSEWSLLIFIAYFIVYLAFITNSIKAKNN